ncbi:hypothetical protein J6590_023287 [Homalodisca vitripennis]|nr:hypothetical protein J6590_023287 [Homalodisca vitripennis]
MDRTHFPMKPRKTLGTNVLYINTTIVTVYNVSTLALKWQSVRLEETGRSRQECHATLRALTHLTSAT